MSEDTDESGKEELDDSSSESSNSLLRFSFTKSTIADLPSCAVQSLYIENEAPVEVDDEAFVWKDISPSGTKLSGKTKFKKADWMKNKVHSSSMALSAKTKGGSATAVGAKVPNKPSTLKNNPKVGKGAAFVAAGHGLAKASSVPKVPSTGSKNRLKERRLSGTSGQEKVMVTTQKASSGTKVTAQDGRKVGGGSKTKMVKQREKRGNAEHAKHGRSKQ